jgi:hypothetical protein
LRLVKKPRQHRQRSLRGAFLSIPLLPRLFRRAFFYTPLRHHLSASCKTPVQLLHSL